MSILPRALIICVCAVFSLLHSRRREYPWQLRVKKIIFQSLPARSMGSGSLSLNQTRQCQHLLIKRLLYLKTKKEYRSGIINAPI